MLKHKDALKNLEFVQTSETLLTHLQSFGKQIQASDKFNLSLDHRKLSQSHPAVGSKDVGSTEERRHLSNLKNELISKTGLVVRVLKLGATNT